MSGFRHTEAQVAVAQWNALPNYMGDQRVLPMVDVSGSMGVSVSGATATAMDVAISLGMYISDKNSGVFKDVILTFSANPELMKLKGNVIEKYSQLKQADWDMNTDIARAFDKVLSVAVGNKVAHEDMPEYIMILSDMQFDQCANYSGMEMIEAKYQQAGYNVPKIVFWNLRGYDNVPVRSDSHGTAMISGFSPAILEAVLSNELDEFTPEGVMFKAIMNPRYDI